ncbi:glycine zipper 2TM domain-containing protein [Ramlibacter sp. MAHUQ-53]|uniref:glycine zipper 2TM domain-containing protein n=1 Tax=unclassified Ramlibacter TaxID=2617605 RepID=UPI00362F03B2
MRPILRILAAAGLALLAACAQYPTTGTAQTAAYPQAGTAPASLEWGRVTSIEYLPPGTPAAARGPNVVGAVVGGVAGAVLGHQIGGGSGRDAATVLGGVAGAAAGSQVGRGAPAGAATSGPAYRITVQTDQGVSRVYEVQATGDLRVGDRVRIENNVIYRS